MSVWPKLRATASQSLFTIPAPAARKPIANSLKKSSLAITLTAPVPSSAKQLPRHKHKQGKSLRSAFGPMLDPSARRHFGQERNVAADKFGSQPAAPEPHR